MTPVERAARALGMRNFPNMHDGWIDRHWPEFIDDVRAVLQEIRAPSDDMLEAADRLGCPIGTADMWQAMVEAAIREETLPDRSEGDDGIGPAA